MEYEIIKPDNENFIIIKRKGKIICEEVYKSTIEAHKLGKKLNIKKFLVDSREAINVDSVTNNYAYINKTLKSDEVINRSARIAILVSEGDKSHRFVETTARNSGTIERVFTDFEAAKNYLEK